MVPGYELYDAFKFMGIDTLIVDDTCIAIIFKEGKIIRVSCDAQYQMVDQEHGEYTRLDMDRFIHIVESSNALYKKDSLFSLYYVAPFLLLFPDDNEQLMISKVGPQFMPFDELSELWKNRVPYVITREFLCYEEDATWKQIAHGGPCHINLISNLFYKMAWEMDSYQSVSMTVEGNNKTTHTETITLPDGDLIIMHFEQGAIIELRHMMK